MVFAAALLLAQAQSVTLQSGAVPLKMLMPELSKSSGLTMVASKDLEWHIVYVRVKDAPTAEVMKHLATVTDGAWEKTDDGRTILKRDPVKVAKAREDEKKELIAGINEAFKRSAADKDTRPDQKYLYAMAQRVGIPALSSIPNNGRVVYSNSPTQVQRQFNFDTAALQGLLLEHNKRVDLANASPRTETDEEMKMLEGLVPPELMKMAKEMEESMKPKRIESAPSKIDLIFARRYGSVSIQLSMFDAQGKKLSDFNTDLYPNDYEDGDVPEPTGKDEGGKEGEEAKPAPDKSPALKLSKDALMLLSYNAHSDEDPGSRDKTKVEALKQRLLAFRTSDPYLAMYTEVLDLYAGHNKDNLILKVDDDLSMFLRENPTINSLEECFELKKENGWTSGSLLTFGDGSPVNRDLLADAIAIVAKGPHLSIDDRAWMAANQDSIGKSYGSIASVILSIFGAQSYRYGNEELLKLYGNLSVSQRQAARSNAGLAVSTLSPEARRIVNQLAYGADFQVKPYGVDEADFDEESFLTMDFAAIIKREMANQGLRMDYLMEPTESMPRGIPSDAYIKIKDGSDKAFIPVSPPGQRDDMFYYLGGTGGMTEGMLASMLAMSDMMPAEMGMNQMPKEVRPVTRNSMTITLHCTPQVGCSETHREVKNADSKPVKMTELGADFDKLLAKRKEDMKRMKPMFEMGMGMGRRGTPPPLP